MADLSWFNWIAIPGVALIVVIGLNKHSARISATVLLLAVAFLSMSVAYAFLLDVDIVDLLGMRSQSGLDRFIVASYGAISGATISLSIITGRRRKRDLQ